MKKNYTFLVAVVAMLLGAGAQAQTISRFAGDTVAGYLGDLGPATAAMMNQPIVLARDGSGNIYIGEGNGNRIRMVDGSGIISTYAGTGVAGFAGDGSPATMAQFNGPDGITFNSAGDMVIADFGNNRIRKIDHTTGIISTIAGTGTAGFSGSGGPASAAQFNHPRDVKFDAAGNLYICDWSNYRIRKIDLSGNISTVTGTGVTGYTGDGGPATAATNNLPYRLAFNSAGNLFFVDGGNNSIRMINMTTGIISTVVGSPTGASGFSGDNGPATAALLNLPTAIAFDIADNMYIADRGNGRIRKVNIFGIIKSVVGSGPSFETGDGGPATAATINKPFDVMLDPSQNMYIADINGNTVRKVTPDPSLGIAQSAPAGNDLDLWPNPNRGVFNISGSIGAVPVQGIETISVTVTNVLGASVYQDNVPTLNGKINEQVVLGNVPAGLYLVKVTAATDTKVFRMVVQ